MKYTIDAKHGGNYDVIVCGGGASGVMAAIAAGRQGARTLLLERTFTIGGMLTLGEAGITKFTEHCKDVDVYKKEVLDVLATNPRSVQVAGGLPHEYALRMIGSGGALGTHGEAGSYVFTDRYCAQMTLVDMLEEAGVEVLYDTRVCMARMEGETIRGVVAINKEGFVEYSAACVIDATGDADVAALAGVEYHYGANEVDMQEGCGRYLGETQVFGTMYRVQGVDFGRLFDHLKQHPDQFCQHPFGVMSLENAMESYENGEMCVFQVQVKSVVGQDSRMQVYNLPAKDEAILLGPGCGYAGNGLDARSISDGQHALLRGVHRLTELLKGYPGFEHAAIAYMPDVGIRETRHIVGEYTINAVDVLSQRDFEDSIASGGHPVDIQPLPPEVHDMDMNHWRFHIPYRIMVPAKVENLLVTGRPISATRLASGSIRPTVQCMALGEAAGIAAAMAAAGNMTPRQVNVACLREKLLENGAIL